MRVEIGYATSSEIHQALGNSTLAEIPGIFQKLDHLVLISEYVWVGKANDEIVCAFGVIPPCLLANKAYLWSITTDKVDEHKFLFIRHSRMMIERIHREFPIIIGHARLDDHSIRWLRWLGAVFSEPTEKGIPFVIERKTNGA